MAKNNSMMLFQRGTTSELDKIDILDGQVLLDTGKKQILVDEENERNIYAGKETASEIKLGEKSYTYLYYGKDKITQTVNGESSKTSDIIKTYSKLITDLSKRIYDLEVLINGGNLTDYIRKDELIIETDANNNLSITKTY